jgi:pyridoxine 5'-phosphate synthase PdxJ
MIRGHLYLGKRMASILKIPAGADRDGAKARLRAELGNELSEAKAKVVKLETDLERAKRRAEGEVSVVELCEGQYGVAKKDADLQKAKGYVAQLERYASLSEESFAFTAKK